jgi:hypothetical protein
VENGDREKCNEFLLATDEKRNWKDIKITIFDAPQATDKPYSTRLELLHQRMHATLLF